MQKIKQKSDLQTHHKCFQEFTTLEKKNWTKRTSQLLNSLELLITYTWRLKIFVTTLVYGDECL